MVTFFKKEKTHTLSQKLVCAWFTCSRAVHATKHGQGSRDEEKNSFSLVSHSLSHDLHTSIIRVCVGVPSISLTRGKRQCRARPYSLAAVISLCITHSFPARLEREKDQSSIILLDMCSVEGVVYRGCKCVGSKIQCIPSSP